MTCGYGGRNKIRGSIPSSCFCRIMAACCSFVRWNSVPDCYSGRLLRINVWRRKDCWRGGVGKEPYRVFLLLLEVIVSAQLIWGARLWIGGPYLSASFLLVFFASFVTLVAASHVVWSWGLNRKGVSVCDLRLWRDCGGWRV